MSRIDARLAVIYANALANGATSDDVSLALIGRARAAARTFVDDRRNAAIDKRQTMSEQFALGLEAAFLAGYLVGHMTERERDGPQDN